MTLKERILDCRNIYSAIYAVPSLLAEKTLLEEDDLKLINSLSQYGSKHQSLLGYVKRFYLTYSQGDIIHPQVGGELGNNDMVVLALNEKT